MKPDKSYLECLAALSPDAVYKGLLGYGYFAEKLPPVFTSVPFLEYCLKHPPVRHKKAEERQYVTYENIGHNNVPRQLGIPEPFAYERLCNSIRDNWVELLRHFKKFTQGDVYKVSRIHVRKLRHSPAIFKMAYKTVGDRARCPVHEIKVGKCYKVSSDISQCFPSIYTHAIPWALVTKEIAKKDRSDKFWYNRLDHDVQANKYGETNGLLIGPHSSNIISEIILVCVDSALRNAGFDYIRSIDDYECYTETREDAERFVVTLAAQLKEFNLNINRKKTVIVELPAADDGDWTRKLRNYVAHLDGERWGAGQISAFWDVAMELYLKENDSAVLFYALKQVSRIDLTEDARVFYVNQVLQLTALRPYLFTKLEECLFDPFNVEIARICSFSDRMYKRGLDLKCYEMLAFALYYAIRFGFTLSHYDAAELISTKDIVAITLGNCYAKAFGLSEVEYRKEIKSILTAKDEKNETLYQSWLYCYEFASARQLAKKEGLRDIKNAGVSFLLPVDRIRIGWSENRERRFINWGNGWDGPMCVQVIKNAKRDFERRRPNIARRQRFEEYIKCVLANFYFSVIENLNVIIPKSMLTYSNMQILDCMGNPLDFELATWIIRWLKTNCYVGERCGSEGTGATFYWAKDKLLREFQSGRIIGVGRHFPAQKIVQEVAIRNARRQEVDKSVGAIGIRYAQAIKQMNDVNRRHRFTCLPNPRLGETQFVPQMRAIFNLSSTKYGGRMYPNAAYRGPDYQTIHSEFRTTIKIDGKNTVELDYSGLHINILYAHKDLQCVSDPYAFLGEELRPAAKLAILVMLNAKRRQSVGKVLESRFRELSERDGLSIKSQKLLSSLRQISDFDEFVAQIETNFAPISEFFYHDAGRWLQREDSELAVSIFDHFSAKGVPVLSVHDSFIIEGKYADELRAVMSKVYTQQYPGYTINVK